MIRALWFMIKVGFLVGLAVWIADRPGFVEMAWLDYRFKINVGLFLLALVGIILLAIFVHGIIYTIVDFPRVWRRYREYMRQKKGYRALTLGLSAVAAGDAKSALQQAEKTARLMPDDKGLPLLLQAQAARLSGQEEEARKKFAALVENKDTAFLGLRGLLQAALDAGNYTAALTLARHALGLHPKQPWILRLVYDLEVRLRDWPSARKTLQQAERAGALSREKAKSDRIAMLLDEADRNKESGFLQEALAKIRKAYGIDPYYAPTVLRLAAMQMDNGQRRAAARIVSKAWVKEDRPEYAELWDSLAPESRTKKPLARLNWFEKFADANPQSQEARLGVARVAMEQGLWGEARKNLSRALEAAPGAKVYRMMAELEERSGGGAEAAKMWLEKAADAPPENRWVCSASGRIYDSWHPVAEPHGSFNTIIWDTPQAAVLGGMLRPGMGEAVLEALR